MPITVGLLIAAIVGLVLGPILMRKRTQTHRWQSVVDGFVILAVGGLSVLHLLPEAFAQGGPLALLFAAIGVLVPGLMEKKTGRAGPLLLLAALIPHAAIESAALGAASDANALSLGIAVAAHRLPIGLVVYMSFKERMNTQAAWFGVGTLVATTLLGFFVGDSISGSLSTESFAWLAAFVGGSLLHVVFSHSVDHSEDHGHSHTHSGCCVSAPRKVSPRWAACGAIMGGVVLVAALSLSTTGGHGEHTHRFIDSFMSLTLISAPALLIAFVLAGLLGAIITPARASWLGRGSAPVQASKGVIFGLPLPICSCGVLPLYETLVRRGVPTTAALGFLVATPELGLDALLLSLPLLGTEMTIARLVAAFGVAMVVALVVGRMVTRTEGLITDEKPAEKLTFKARIRQGLHFGLVELFDKTIPWIIAGLLIAAWVEPLLGHQLLAGIPSMFQVVLFALIGIPVYVCASGATPIAAVAVMQSVSPGAALAFLLAGPATNVTTFGILSQLHGRKAAIGFGAAVFLGAVLSGWAVDAAGVKGLTTGGHAHHDGHSWIQWGALGALVVLFVVSLFRQGPRSMTERITNPVHAHADHHH